MLPVQLEMYSEIVTLTLPSSLACLLKKKVNKCLQTVVARNVDNNIKPKVAAKVTSQSHSKHGCVEMRLKLITIVYSIGN